MPTRERIVETADRLFYEQGYDHTSFATIAGAVGISRGNFYHHFRTKDDILEAVITLRSADTRRMLREWESWSDEPAKRILAFARIVARNRVDIEQHGCPAGTLTTELAKLDHPARPQAVAVLTLFRQWLADQFAAAGRPDDADALALHVLAFSQGVATISNAFADPAFVDHELTMLEHWLTHTLPPTTPES